MRPVTALGPTAHRRKATSVIGAALVALGLVAAFGLVAASPATAATTATFTDTGSGTTVTGTTGGGPLTAWAGELRLTLSGGATATAYCIDLETSIARGTSDLVEQDWATSGIAELARVTFILNAYGTPAAPGPDYAALQAATGATAAQMAAGIQTAIWHFTDGFTLTSGGPVAAVYDAVVAAAAGATAPEPPPSLAVTPASATATEGAPAGPFALSTTATGPVSLTVPDGAAVVSWSDPSVELTTLADGDTFGIVLRTPGPGPVTVTATVSATVPSGRVFAKGGVQRLILAAPVTATATASVTAGWVPAEQPTTTVEQPTTTVEQPTTTAAPTTTAPPTTTAVEQPTTTAAPTTTVADEVVVLEETVTATTTAVAGGTLPRTGGQADALALIALATVAAGLGLLAISRQRAR